MKKQGTNKNVRTTFGVFCVDFRCGYCIGPLLAYAPWRI